MAVAQAEALVKATPWGVSSQAGLAGQGLLPTSLAKSVG